jgi:diguanylate cyclase (GGDEF)-like protein/PAS domain S-box-containing protein
MPLPARDDPQGPVADANPDARELSQIEQLQAALEGSRASEAEWRDVVETLPHIVWITRPDGYHVYFNQQWMDFTGLSLEESLGDGWNPPFHPEARPVARRLWAQATRTGEPYEIEYRLRRHDGVYRWMLGRALPLRNLTGEIVKWFGTCTDIGELKTALEDAAELREKLERRASHDSLTGLANRDLLFEQMELLLGPRGRRGVAVAFVDLDRFKAVNDRLGHRVGDQLLVHVADRLRAGVRQGDVTARIGGDEFVVVGEVDDPMDARHFGQRVAAAVQGPVGLEDEQVHVAASVGVTFVERGARPDVDLVLSRADDRMYEVKRRRDADEDAADPAGMAGTPAGEGTDALVVDVVAAAPPHDDGRDVSA